MYLRPILWILPVLILLTACRQPQPDNKLAHREPIPIPQLKRISQEQYGIQVGAHQVLQDSFPEDQLLMDVLKSHGVSGDIIDTIDSRSDQAFDVRNMKAGHPYTILKNTDSRDVEFFIYEENEEEFVVIDLREGVSISRGNLPVQTEIRTLFLPIHSTLYEAVQQASADVALVKALEKIFAWQVDFRHLDAGDFCHVIFEERYVDGTFVGIGQVLASKFHQKNNDYYAFYHQEDSTGHFYDERGIHVRKAFLKSPIPATDSSDAAPTQYDRTSSGYFYFSEAKEPVLAVASGQISTVKQRKDGLMLMLVHSNVYSTQYLHLSGIASGLGETSTVMQGDTIGFAGFAQEHDAYGIGLRYWSQGKPGRRPIVQDEEKGVSNDLSENESFMRQIRAYRRKLDKTLLPST